MNTVRKHVYMDKRNTEALKLLDTDKEFRSGLADILRSAKPGINDGGIATFYSGQDPIKLARISDGTWVLVSW